MCRLCAQCPFREDSQFAYDSDAHEVLSEGNAPSCHVVVGFDSIFAHAPLDPPNSEACKGYRAWMAGAPGFREPATQAQPQ